MTDRVLYANFNWSGGRHRFALPMDYASVLWHQLPDPHPRLRRLLSGEWDIHDVTLSVRAGLIGGRAFLATDTTALDAIIDEHIIRKPLAEGAVLAKAILLVALFGVPKRIADAGVTPAEIVNAATSAEPVEG